jgi:hypothetical protein
MIDNDESDDENIEQRLLLLHLLSLIWLWKKIDFAYYNFYSTPNVKTTGSSWFSAFKSLVGDKKLTAEDIQPALDKMRDHLIGTILFLYIKIINLQAKMLLLK